MSSFKVLGKNSSGLSEFADADTVLTPQTVQANSGQLTVQSQSATPVLLGTGGQVPAGQLLNTAGSGNINLPNNGSARFNIEGSAVSANVTATNLGTLTGGGNADALHTHSGVQAANLDISGLTLWSTPASGEGGYISANNTLAKAKADAVSTSAVMGVYAGTAGTVLRLQAKCSLLLDASLTLAANDRIYLSDVTAGRFTNVEPTTAGHVSFEVGRLLDTTSYNSGAGSAQPVLCDSKTPVVIS